MAIVEVSIVPLGTSTPSVSKYVAKALQALEGENIEIELTPMGTIIEGDLDEILRLVKLMHESPFTEGAMRVVTTIKIDDRRDKTSSMSSKIESVKRQMRT